MSANDFEYYEREGKRYDRISTILDYFAPPQLVAWKVKVGRKEAGLISRAALRIGSQVDAAIRADVNGAKPTKLTTLDAKNCYNAYSEWKFDYRVAPTTDMKESPTVYNDELMVAGTPDLDWWLRDIVVDVKCASSIKPAYWLQTEFYGRCMGRKDKAILRLHKGLGIYEFKTMSLNDEHWAAICGLIKAYRYFKSMEEHGEGEQDESSTTNNAQ